MRLVDVSDRTVHAVCGDLEIVRYDRAGKWYFEYDPPRLRGAHQVTLGEAVEEVVFNDGEVFYDRPGGRAFDARVRKAFAEAAFVDPQEAKPK